MYYALGGFSCAGGKFSGTMNATHNKQLAAMGIKVPQRGGDRSDVCCHSQVESRRDHNTYIQGFKLLFSAVSEKARAS